MEKTGKTSDFVARLMTSFARHEAFLRFFGAFVSLSPGLLLPFSCGSFLVPRGLMLNAGGLLLILAGLLSI